VAVVDSGIHGDHPHVGGIARGVFLGDTATTSDFVDRIGHGTAVAAAIHEKAPLAELLAVRVFDRTLWTSAEQLARAIIWSADERARMINLSLGTPNAERAEVLREAVEYAAARGSLVISARELNGVSWLPGSLPGVVGVRLGSDDREAITVQLVNDSFTIEASRYPRAIPGVPPERNLSGVSFSVANASGFLARLLSVHAGVSTLEDLEATLFENHHAP
jgi:subtilase family protein